jgi:hypothetical protein
MITTAIEEEVTIDNIIAVPEGMQEVLQRPAW